MGLLKMILIAFVLISCGQRLSHNNVAGDVIDLDTLLRSKEVNTDLVIGKLNSIGNYLIQTDTRTADIRDWRATVNYKWNEDSTITLIRSVKTFRKGFKREVALNLGDTTLFVYRFSTHPLIDANTMEMGEDYSFIEEYEYLKGLEPIRYLNRVAWSQKNLSDTINFRTIKLADGTESIQRDLFKFEIDKLRRIMGSN